MEREKVCVFCGQKPSAFRSASIQCGATVQLACKSCEKELAGLDEVELCRRALRRGLAEKPPKLEERIALITQAEEHRPACLRCGAKLKFGKVQSLDNSPMRDNVFMDTFDVLPAYCVSCGKIEFYHPKHARNDKFVAYLIYKDSRD